VPGAAGARLRARRALLGDGRERSVGLGADFDGMLLAPVGLEDASC
jgi:microsomal dipeptidase-like Zn-dependent dipeptidase